MLTIAMMLLQAATAALPGPAPSEALRPDWVSKPSVEALIRCSRPIRVKPVEALVTMRCATAPKDHIASCVVVSNTAAPDTRVETAALCATEYFRIRAKGPDGLPVMDVPVTVPLGFVSPKTYNRMVKAARTEPYAPPPVGTVDEAVIVFGLPY